MAISAFVLAMLSPIVPLLGIVAVVLGWLALHDIALGKKVSGRGLATAAIAIPLAVYGLWWLVAGIVLWIALSAFRDILSFLQLEGLYDDIPLFDELQDRAILLVLSGIVSMVCAVVIPIVLNRAIARQQSLSREQTTALIGLPTGFLWLVFSALIGNVFLLLSLWLVSMVLSYYVLTTHPKKVDLANKFDFTHVRVRWNLMIAPKDTTATHLIHMAIVWIMSLMMILVFWLVISEVIAWYLGLVTGLVAGTYAIFLVPISLNVDISQLQRIDVKRVATNTFGPVLALVVSGLLWWPLYLVTLAVLGAVGWLRLKKRQL